MGIYNTFYKTLTLKGLSAHTKRDLNYYYHILNNLDYYLKHYNNKEKFYCDYKGKIINPSILFRHTGKSYFDRHIVCPFSRKPVKYNIFEKGRVIKYDINNKKYRMLSTLPDKDINILIKFYNIYYNNDIVTLYNYLLKIVKKYGIDYINRQYIKSMLKDIGICFNRLKYDGNKIWTLNASGTTATLYDFITNEPRVKTSVCITCNKEYNHLIYRYDYSDKTFKYFKLTNSDKVCGNKECYYTALKTSRQTGVFGIDYDSMDKKVSNSIKKSILSGNYTPKSNNYRTHKRIKYDGMNFRSSWEYYFYRYQLKNGIKLCYEELRLPYYIDGNKKIYIVDFIDHNNKIVYEIKPRAHKYLEVNITKEYVLLEWCKVNGYCYKVITEIELSQIKDESFIKSITEDLDNDKENVYNRLMNI